MKGGVYQETLRIPIGSTRRRGSILAAQVFCPRVGRNQQIIGHLETWAGLDHADSSKPATMTAKSYGFRRVPSSMLR
jgi:hypothetical protein